MGSEMCIRDRPSGTQFKVNDGESVLAAALRQGIMLAYSCRNGTCASCHGKVVKGQVDYPLQPPNALTESQQQQGEALFCQAVPQTDLVIEAREIDAVRDLPVRMLPVRVQDKTLLSPTVARLRLSLPKGCLLYTSPSPRDLSTSRMPSSA